METNVDHFRNTNAEELAGREFNPERDAAQAMLGFARAWGAAQGRTLMQSDVAVMFNASAEQMSRAVNHGEVSVGTLRKWVAAWNELRQDGRDHLVLVLDGSKILVERKVDRLLYPRVS